MPLKITIELSDEQLRELAKLVAEEMGQAVKGPFTIEEFAKEVGEHRSTIHRKVKAGVIIKINMPGDTKISLSELERYRTGGKPPK